jgi:ABC-type phosphate transport system permease subunit
LSFIPEEYSQKVFADYERIEDPNLIANGYKSASFFDNLGGFLIVIAMLLLVIAMVLVFRGCLKVVKKVSYESPRMFFLTQRLGNMVDEASKAIFWTVIITSAIHSYTKIALSNWVGLSISKF